MFSIISKNQNPETQPEIPKFMFYHPPLMKKIDLLMHMSNFSVQSFLQGVGLITYSHNPILFYVIQYCNVTGQRPIKFEAENKTFCIIKKDCI